jgi:hypothetical protein
MQVCQMVWSRAVVLIIIGTVLCSLVGCAWGQAWAAGVAALYLLIFIVLMYFTVRVVSGGAFLERCVLLSGGGVATVLFTGSTGLRLSASIGEDTPWYGLFDYGETDIRLVWAGVIMFGMTLATVVTLQKKKSQAVP